MFKIGKHTTTQLARHFAILSINGHGMYLCSAQNYYSEALRQHTLAPSYVNGNAQECIHTYACAAYAYICMCVNPTLQRSKFLLERPRG
jgi:hypothetical protein